MDFGAIFAQQHEILKLELQRARSQFQHSGIKGGVVEAAVREFLEGHLPRSYSVGTGEAVASESDGPSSTSRQIDVVISNQLQPFQSGRDVPTTFLIEGVHIAGEIKTAFGRADVNVEAEKGLAFKALRAKNTSRLVGFLGPDNWESFYVFYRPYFLLSLETAGQWRAILFEVMKTIRERRAIPFDGVFLLEDGIAILIAPFLKVPFSDRVGIPFEYVSRGQTKTGSIHVLKISAILAAFLGWISLFRTAFFEDMNPIAIYLQGIIDASVTDFLVLSEEKGIDMPLDAYAKKITSELETSGPFDYLFSRLSVEFGGKDVEAV